MNQTTQNRQAKTRQQLAEEYGIVYRTFQRWIKGSGIELPSRKLITPKFQDLIYNAFGHPQIDRQKKDAH
ncbi:MAG: hypothetical protein GC192_11635 [Bacteroidetes bacterium]|nr:hypothetical protein [Bacteroidota bacterium]